VANSGGTIRRSRLCGSSAVLAILTLLAGCSHFDNGLTKADYRDLDQRTPPGPPAAAQKAEPPIPELQPILAAPPPPALEQHLVSVNVPDANVPVRDVLLELARKVGVDLDLDPRIAGGVIIYAKDRPFSEVINRICDMANLRYSFKDNVLRVELDTMYIHNYRVELPNITRKTTMDVSTSTDVFSAVQGGGGGGGQNNSSSRVASESTNDPWKEVDDNLKQILTNSSPRSQPVESNVYGTNAGQTVSAVPVSSAAPAPRPTPAPTPAPVAPAAPSATPAGQAPTTNGTAPAAGATGQSPFAATDNAAVLSHNGASNQATTDNGAGTTGTTTPAATTGGTGTTGNGAAGTGAAGTGNPIADTQRNLLNQAGANEGVAQAGTSASPPPASSGTPITPTSYYSINRAAGIISVFGTAKQQKLVQAYLTRVQAEATAQVLIEAKVVEVDLSDQFKAGVDWQQLVNKNTGLLTVGSSTGTGAGFLADQASFAKQSLDASTANPFSLSYAGNSFNAALQFVQGFGTTRTLSSPRITVTNNHTAVLKVAENQVYFSLTATVTSTPSTNGGTPSQTATYTSQLHTVPIGVVMTVQPVIDSEKDQVTLNLRPSVSNHSGDVSDPAVGLMLASACAGSVTGACSPTSISSAVTNSNVPVVEVREMDSVVTVPSGDILVMGGMMQTKTQKQETGVPGAADIPLLGNLFKVQSHETDVTELVIFLKATIVHNPSESIDWADKDVYKRYMQDPRPLAF
jgi:general secretion pathway protein D